MWWGPGLAFEQDSDFYELHFRKSNLGGRELGGCCRRARKRGVSLEASRLQERRRRWVSHDLEEKASDHGLGTEGTRW